MIEPFLQIITSRDATQVEKNGGKIANDLAPHDSERCQAAADIQTDRHTTRERRRSGRKGRADIPG